MIHRTYPMVLIVDDEPAVRWLLQQGLPTFLPGFAMATVANGQEAIDYLTAYPVDALVTDMAMPVKDGFELLAHVRNHHPELPVVVLATMAPRQVSAGAPQFGTLHVLQKPASPELVARHVLQARSAKSGGHRTGSPLATLLELMRLERKTCALLVRAGDQKGRLHFLSGELVNAYVFGIDIEGEAAARHLLALEGVTIDFERSLHNHVRTIHAAVETLLLGVEAPADAVAAGFPDVDPPPVTAADATPAAATEAPHDDGAEVPTPSVGAALDAAIAVLQVAISGLRTRSAATATLLDTTAPDLLRAAAAVGRPMERGLSPDDARLTAAFGEVSALASRLLEAADALGEAANA